MLFALDRTVDEEQEQSVSDGDESKRESEDYEDEYESVDSSGNSGNNKSSNYYMTEDDAFSAS